MTKKKFRASVLEDDGSSACGIELPFNPKDVFGKVRAPVRATINRFTFGTTTASMGGRYWIPLNQKNRAGAGVEAGDQVTLTLELDDEPRTVAVPDDLARALKKSATARRGWEKLSYTHRREHAEAIEGAKRPETRARRLAKTLEVLGGPPAKGARRGRTPSRRRGSVVSPWARRRARPGISGSSCSTEPARASSITRRSPFSFTKSTDSPPGGRRWSRSPTSRSDSAVRSTRSQAATRSPRPRREDVERPAGLTESGARRLIRRFNRGSRWRTGSRSSCL